jgi:glucose/arabinose dehydrogenase
MSGNSIAPSSERELLSFAQPFPNHNGGDLHFGPDDYLYIAAGDGGGANDTFGNGQKLSTLLGKILRIDVNGAPYAVPVDNPFVGVEDAMPEIYAYGLRNPWRFSFDSATGALWAADVGQNAWEEVNVITAGGNYGWNQVEGFECFKDEGCDLNAYIPPVHVYGHDEGISITGGFVYRGSAIPELYGKYVYADYGFGTIWALDAETHKNMGLQATEINPSAFAQGPDGELYILDHTSGTVFKIVPR